MQIMQEFIAGGNNRTGGDGKKGNFIACKRRQVAKPLDILIEK